MQQVVLIRDTLEAEIPEKVCGSADRDLRLGRGEVAPMLPSICLNEIIIGAIQLREATPLIGYTRRSAPRSGAPAQTAAISSQRSALMYSVQKAIND